MCVLQCIDFSVKQVFLSISFYALMEISLMFPLYFLVTGNIIIQNVMDDFTNGILIYCLNKAWDNRLFLSTGQTHNVLTYHNCSTQDEMA